MNDTFYEILHRKIQKTDLKISVFINPIYVFRTT